MENQSCRACGACNRQAVLGPPETSVLTCPSVLQLTYYRRGVRHRLFIAVDIRGNTTVGLRIGRQWSGWHGRWSHTDTGGLLCHLHYSGRSNLVRPHTFERLASRVYQIWQGQYIRAHAEMITMLLIPGQLADADREWEWLAL